MQDNGLQFKLHNGQYYVALADLVSSGEMARVTAYGITEGRITLDNREYVPVETLEAWLRRPGIKTGRPGTDGGFQIGTATYYSQAEAAARFGYTRAWWSALSADRLGALHIDAQRFPSVLIPEANIRAYLDGSAEIYNPSLPATGHLMLVYRHRQAHIVSWQVHRAPPVGTGRIECSLKRLRAIAKPPGLAHGLYPL